MHPTLKLTMCLAVPLTLLAPASALAQLPPSWKVDKSLYPKAYGVLADGRLMHPAAMADWPLKIDGTRQLFVDDELIASIQGLEWRAHAATKHPANPLIVPDREWEGGNCSFQCVERDPATGRYRMWYSGTPKYTLPDGKRAPWVTCYAESEDGIRWQKPSLGLHEVQGSRDNNVVIEDGGFFGVMHTPDDPRPERRYKALVLRLQNQPGEGYFLYVSADGLHWVREREERVVPSQQGYVLPTSGIGDTSIFRWDPRLRKYIGDVKFVLPGKMRVRGIMESDDLVHWSRPRMTLFPDALDDPRAQIYGHHGFVYESLWLGLVRIMHDDFVPESYKQTTVELTSSRDGRHWSRVGNREQFIPLGRPDEWDPHYHDPCSDPIVIGDEIRFYYRSLPLWKDMHDKQSRIGLATLRRDGFASLDAGDAVGTLVTRPLTFKGRKLFVNAQIEAGGSLKAEWRNRDGQPIAGWTFDKCAPLAGDLPRGELTWAGRSELPADETPRLAFELKNARLYSFWIE